MLTKIYSILISISAIFAILINTPFLKSIVVTLGFLFGIFIILVSAAVILEGFTMGLKPCRKIINRKTRTKSSIG